MLSDGAVRPHNPSPSTTLVGTRGLAEEDGEDWWEGGAGLQRLGGSGDDRDMSFGGTVRPVDADAGQQVVGRTPNATGRLLPGCDLEDLADLAQAAVQFHPKQVRGRWLAMTSNEDQWLASTCTG